MALRAAGGGFTVTVKLSLLPEYEAVRFTAVATVTDPAVMANVPEVAPFEMVTVAGTLITVGEDVIEIAAPVLGAGAVNATVHVDDVD